MAENKTVQTGVRVEDFLDAVQPEKRRREGWQLARMFGRVTGFEPRMWGPSMVGYGRYAYRYESGHSGEAFLTGFSPRKAALTIYVVPGRFDLYADELARLGKHRTSVSCLYLGGLDRVDLDALEAIVRDSVERMKAIHPGWQPQ